MTNCQVKNSKRITKAFHKGPTRTGSMYLKESQGLVKLGKH